MQFLFYDLETSGRSARWQRIMQFAAQATDEKLQPVGEPIQHLVRLTEEVLPEPAAIMLTGITPQMTRRDGLSEAGLWQEIEPAFQRGDTCVLGFNSIRFDDEFLRYSRWRSFRDPYTWAWENGNSRWDLLDVARMTRALRPDGIEWPFDSEGHLTNRLGDLAKANKLEHKGAHSALGDVRATIALAQLLRNSQPKLWQWLLGLRLKKPLTAFVQSQDGPFVYTSGSYPKETLHTTAVMRLAPTARGDGVWVYDLRADPDEWLGRSDAQLEEAYENRERLPLKQLSFGRAPAVAPLSVLDEKSRDRLQLDMGTVEANLKKLRGKSVGDFLQRLQKRRDERFGGEKTADPDLQLYDGFLPDADRALCQRASQLDAGGLKDFAASFADERLPQLLVRYKARNYPQTLTATERAQWEQYREARLKADLPGYYQELEQLTQSPDLTDAQRHNVSELDLWAQSIS
jgi:exodeoxyribonuclease-1